MIGGASLFGARGTAPGALVGVAGTTRRLLADTGTAPNAVQAISFSGQIMGAVPLDAAYRPVRPALIWADHRSSAQAARLIAELGADPAYRLLGDQIHPTYSLTKILWVREHEPEVFARVAHVCLAKDYVVRISGGGG